MDELVVRMEGLHLSTKWDEAEPNTNSEERGDELMTGIGEDLSLVPRQSDKVGEQRQQLTVVTHDEERGGAAVRLGPGVSCFLFVAAGWQRCMWCGAINTRVHELGLMIGYRQGQVWIGSMGATTNLQLMENMWTGGGPLVETSRGRIEDLNDPPPPYMP
ncbi:hypothetical protein V3481_018618 [Fusarium oxysporum f. sp. vasinfectum]